MQLSIIIVNYNVKHFLELCLSSVQKAVEGIAAELIVVDNASSDGSDTYIQEFFPEVRYIYLTENLGFAKANNLAAKQAKGEFVLFLNPDTIIAEDTLHICLQTFKAQVNIGVLGVRMIDGNGNYLPESKRGLPTALTSFFKITGLYYLRPTHKTVAAYYHGHLSATQNHEIDVVAGAFMMLQKNTFFQAGAFDERYFMYAEDVDLSYSLQKMGRKNFYLADTTIIHFKGESTIRSSFKFVKIFYQAMLLFVAKHYKGFAGWSFGALLKIGIVLSAMTSLLVNSIKALKQMFYRPGQKKYSYTFFENASIDSVLNDLQGEKAILYHCGKSKFKNIIASVQKNGMPSAFVNARQNFLLQSGDKKNKGLVLSLNGK